MQSKLSLNEFENSCFVLQVATSEDMRKKDFKHQKRLEKQMTKQRNKQLLEANKEEDRIIRQLEKQLGLKKRKSKTLPKSFVSEGLDCKIFYSNYFIYLNEKSLPKQFFCSLIGSL